MKEGVTDFLEGKYKSPFCHECREDPERCKKAMEHDGNLQTAVQKIKCKACEKLLNWWWFSKLPLTDEEKQAVAKRGGDVWRGTPKNAHRPN